MEDALVQQTPAKRPYEVRNAHFDRLVNRSGLRWMGQNTNHLPPHQDVLEAMLRCIQNREFQIYAPPAGFEQLRSGIVADLGLAKVGGGQAVLVSDGAIASLYHVCHTLLRPGDEFLTTDPTWNWPISFARSVGAAVVQIPIYGPEYGYRLSPERLAEHLGPNTKAVYIVDPNNPLGTVLTAAEVEQIVTLLREHDAFLIQDCTYRDFAYDHTLAATLYPERTITIYSFSKWLGLAGMRIGAVVSHPDIIEKLASAPPNNLGSSILAQRAALAGLAIKQKWFPGVLATQRTNQKLIKQAVEGVAGISMPIYPSNANFIIIECNDPGLRPEALCAVYEEHDILIRQGSYHTKTFGHRFVKVSTTVPTEWAEEFAALLPQMVERAHGRNEPVELF
jgi:aspartate/methionine/tyrosine aminotransferase